MTQDDIIKMAHEAGLHLATDVHWMPIIGFDYAKRLIALAAAAEREACARLCDGLDDGLVDGLAGWQYGEAIRARGEQA